MSSTAQARIFDMAAATLRARGHATPEHWAPALEGASRRAPAVRAQQERARAAQTRRESSARYLTPEEREQQRRAAIERVVSDLGGELDDSKSASARAVFRALVTVAIDQAQRRNYRATPSQVTYLLGVENLAYAFGVSRPTIWRRLEELRRAGLVATRRWFTTVAGEGRTAGTLFSVRLTEGRARVYHAELTDTWRDLEADVEAGQSWRRQREALELTGGLNALDGPSDYTEGEAWLLTTALSPVSEQQSVNLMRSTASNPPAELAELFDLPALSRRDRGARVDAVAHAVAGGLRDLRNVNLHRWVIWQALRLADQGQAWVLDGLYQAARRAMANMRETDRELHRPGALYVSLLRDSGLWDQLRAVEPVRVGAVAA